MQVRWALDRAALAPHNESAWSYLRGMMGSDGADCFGDLEAQVAACDLYKYIHICIYIYVYIYTYHAYTHTDAQGAGGGDVPAA